MTTKAEANYREGEGDRRCELCTMFRAPRRCTAVTGTIFASGLCDLYEAKTDEKAKPKKTKEDAGEICRTALERYGKFLERERTNIDMAYEDLEFVFSDNQWPDKILAERNNEDRPVLTHNLLPKFVHQVTGDMRQMRSSIRVVPIDSGADKETAETRGGMCRYIENRSDAESIYTSSADSQVTCGIGAWRVVTEYASYSTFNQELRILGVDDAIAIAWDPDAITPTREDAKWCIVPVDMSNESFKEAYPDAPVEDFDNLRTPTGAGANNYYVGWFDKDFVRVAEYWVKKPVKRLLALMPDGAIQDLTGKDEAHVAEITAMGARVEKRDGIKIVRYLITAAHILEEEEWAGLYIPIVPVIGEEVRIGRKVVRRGLVRSAKDSQRMVNYFYSAFTEAVALQPKAPYLATEKNVEKYKKQWDTANRKNWPYLPYQPDKENGGAAPQRVAPAVASQGIIEGITLSVELMKAEIGIYDAGLGAKSNETSGKAILARQREGDVGSYVYIANWLRAIRHTGTILNDLFPHVYDTERQIRIMGEDGKIDLKWINKPQGMEVMDQYGQPQQQTKTLNDMTTGSYDVVMQTGPSYSTKREEAKEGMIEFLRSSPDAAPLVMDLVAKAQDWPMADEFGKRLEATAPPAVQKLIAMQKKEAGDEEPPEEPTPMEQMEQELRMRAMKAEVEEKEANIQKTLAETAKIGMEIQQPPEGAMMQPPDPNVMLKAEGQDQKNAIDADKANRDLLLKDLAVQSAQLNNEAAQLKNNMLRADLAGKRLGIAQTAEQHDVSMERELTEMQAGEQEAEQSKAELQPSQSVKAVQQIADDFSQGMSALAQSMEAIAQALMMPRELLRDERGKPCGSKVVKSLN